jgi:hypothetical protein
MRHPPKTGSLPARTAILAGLLVTLCACQVQRELVITSQPPGAEVRVDGDPVGRTPVNVPFLHYGTRRVTFYLDGYLTQSQVIDIDPRWFNTFPLDLVSEVLVPIGWRDRRYIAAEMEHGSGALTLPDLESVLERAESLRRAGPEGPRPVETPPADKTGGSKGDPPKQ